MVFNEHSIGEREQISWGKESTFGTPVTPTSIVGYNAVMDPDWNNNWQEILQSGADDRDPQYAEGPKSLKFSLTFYPTSWDFLKYCGYDFTNTGSGPTVHTGSNRNTVQSFTLQWAKRPNNDRVYTLQGCSVINATISFKKATGEGNDGFIEVILECEAQDVVKGSTVTALTLTANPFQWRHTTFTFDNTEVVELNNGSIKIATGINPDESRYCNAALNRTIGETIPKTQRVTSQFNVNVLDSTYFDEWDGANVVANTNLVFQQTVDNNVTFTFNNFRLASPGVDSTNLDGVNNMDMDVKMDSTSIVARDGLSW